MTRAEIIQGLRELADLLESKPEFPLPWLTDTDGKPIWFACLRVWNLEELRDIAKKIGSCSKRYSDDYFELVKTLPSGLELAYYCDREKVCKKVVTYECEDAESILMDISSADAQPVE